MQDDQRGTVEQENSWDLLSQFAEQRERLDPFLLRAVLANTLRRRGFGAIVWSEDGKPEEAKDSRAGDFFAWLIVWSLGVSATEALGLPWYGAPLAMLLVAAVLGVLVLATKQSAVVGVLIAIAWVAVGIVEIINGTFLSQVSATWFRLVSV